MAIPLVTAFSKFFESRREKRYRFDEHRLAAYSQFATSIAEVLWASSANDADARRARAWIQFEKIALTSSAEVVKGAVTLRHTVQVWVDRLRELESTGISFGHDCRYDSSTAEIIKEFHRDFTNSVYHKLNEFHEAARLDMGLPKLNFESVIETIRKYYDF